MSYVVYVNHPNNKAVVHVSHCNRYQHRRRNKTLNGYWKGIFVDFKEAMEFAQSTRKKNIDCCAFCCRT